MIHLTSTKEWREALEESIVEVIVIFKHSNICSASANIYTTLSKLEKSESFVAPIYYVTVQDHRDISKEIANDLGYNHETPQVFVVKNKKVIYVASQESIKIENIIEATT